MSQRTLQTIGILVGLVVFSATVPAKSKNKVKSIAEYKKRLKKLTRRLYSRKLRPYTPRRYDDHGLADKVTPRGQRARGVYVTASFLAYRGPKRIAAWIKKNHLNAVVVDVKDDWGKILWPSKVPLAKRMISPLIRSPRQMIKTFHDAGIYVIARFVCFKDSSLPFVRPDLSMRFQRTGKRLFWAGAGWLDHYALEVHDYLIDLALEWQRYGVDEVQLDYIRFPKGKTGTWGIWLHKGKDAPARDKLIATFLERFDRALSIPLSVDVFGLTTLVDGDPRTLGQTIERMSQYVEVLSPMLYPEGMTTYFKNAKVTKWVYNIIQCGLWRARQKVPHVVMRPWLQAYPDEISFFGSEFIIQQIKHAERGGAHSFLFWNPRMNNGTLASGLRRLGAAYLGRFGSQPDQYKAHRPVRWCKDPKIIKLPPAVTTTDRAPAPVSETAGRAVAGKSADQPARVRAESAKVPAARPQKDRAAAARPQQ